MATALVQSTFAVRGNNQRVPREDSHWSTFRGSKQRAFDRFRRPRGVTPLATLGGTFVTGGQTGRKGCFIPSDEDSSFDEARVNRNDRLHDYCAAEVAGASNPDFEFFDEPVKREKTFAERLLEVDTLSQVQVMAAAEVIAKEPQLLINLYELGVKADEVNDEDKQSARIRAFNLFLRIVATMIQGSGKKVVAHALMSQRMAADGPTLIACLASFARREVRNGYRHRTAFNALRAMGFDNPLTPYLQ